MKKNLFILILLLYSQIGAFSAGTGERDYSFEEPPVFNVQLSKEEIITKLNIIVNQLVEINLSTENDVFQIGYRAQPFTELPSTPIHNSSFFAGNTTAYFRFNFIYNNINQTISLVSGRISTKIEEFPTDENFINIFEYNIINYLNNEGIAYYNTLNNIEYFNALFEYEQINKVNIGFNMNFHLSWGSRTGEGLQWFTINNRQVINQILRFEYFVYEVVLNEYYYWYRFPDIIIAFEYELTDNEKNKIIESIHTEMNNFTDEELDYREPSARPNFYDPSRRYIFERRLIDETNPRNYMIHIWKNNNQYICHISDGSKYFLVDIDLLNDILSNVIPRRL